MNQVFGTTAKGMNMNNKYTSIAIKKDLREKLRDLSATIVKGTKLSLPQTIELLSNKNLEQDKNKPKDITIWNKQKL